MDSRLIIESLPTTQSIELVWRLLRRDFKDSTTLYLLMQNHVLIHGTLDRTDWHGQCLGYRRRSVPTWNLVENIRFFNEFQKRSLCHFFTVLQFDCPLQGLELLVNLKSLVVLSVSNACRPEELVKSWHRAILVESSRWSALRVLNVPQLCSPKLFFDTWRLMPSLLWMGACIESETVRSIPTLDRLVTSAPASSPMELLLWLQQFNSNTDLNHGIVLELEVNPYLAIPSVASYSPVESKLPMMPIFHCYIRKLGRKRPVEQQLTEAPRGKKPKHRGITRKTSPQQFFGWG